MNADIAKPAIAVPWYLILLQGILSIFVGILLVTKPGVAMIIIVRLLGWYWMIKGLFSLVALFSPEAKPHRGWLLVNAVVGIFAGFAVLDHPMISAVFVPSVLVTLVGLAGVFVGVNDLFAAFRGGGVGVGLLGVVSIILGGAILGNTLVGVEVLPYVLGATELVGGALALVFAFKIRSMQQQA